jgi:hypothetical protein
MALLNPPQTLPHVMLLVYRYLLLCADNQTEDISTLRSLLAPPSLRAWQAGGGDDEDDGSTKDTAKRDAEGREQYVVRIAYNALRDLDVLDEIDANTVRLNPALAPAYLRRETGEQNFRQMLRERVLDVKANADLWLVENDAKFIGPRDLTRALAWVLAQDVYQPLRPWNEGSEFSVQHLQQRQLGQEQRWWVFSNDTRWPAFIRWAVYLGFAWKLGVPKSGSQPAHVLLVPDPAEAVRELLPRLAPATGAMVPLPEFLERLAQELPVLDGGVHRDAVLDRMDPRSRVTPANGELSSTLAHALLRLHDDEALTLLNESDTDKRLFPIESGQPRPYSHVRVDRPHVTEARS